MVYAYNHDGLEIAARRLAASRLDNPTITAYLVRKCTAMVERITLRKVFQDRVRLARKLSRHCPDTPADVP